MDRFVKGIYVYPTELVDRPDGASLKRWHSARHMVIHVDSDWIDIVHQSGRDGVQKEFQSDWVPEDELDIRVFARTRQTVDK